MTSLASLKLTADVHTQRMVKLHSRLMNKFKSNPTLTAGLILRLQVELEELENTRAVVVDLCDKITANLDSATDTVEQKKCLEFAINQPDDLRKIYSEALEKFENLRDRFEGKQRDATAVAAAPAVESSLRIKDIEIPEFHGEPRKFLEYKGLFETLVHRNAKYSNPEKMILLRQSLKGEAEKLLSDSTNDLSYPEAWGVVCEWFENRFLIVNALFRDLFALKPIKDSSAVRSLLLEVDSILRGLKSAGQETEHWGSLLQYFVSSKLDDETRRDWLNSCDVTAAYPQFTELKKFLISRCHTAEASNFKVRPAPPSTLKQPAKPPKPNSPKQPRKSYAATSSMPSEACICCGKPFHLLIHCDKFKSRSPYQRYEMIRAARLCNNSSFSGCANCRQFNATYSNQFVLYS